jgi:hypothetical protein
MAKIVFTLLKHCFLTNPVQNINSIKTWKIPKKSRNIVFELDS